MLFNEGVMRVTAISFFKTTLPLFLCRLNVLILNPRKSNPFTVSVLLVLFSGNFRPLLLRKIFICLFGLEVHVRVLRRVLRSHLRTLRLRTLRYLLSPGGGTPRYILSDFVLYLELLPSHEERCYDVT